MLMYWSLLAVALIGPPITGPQVTGSQIRARAVVRVLNSAQISKTTWARSSRRMERVVRESDGRLILLRTVDFE